MIRAIQTNYRGILYRSRLEARWAVFFDVLGIKHEYEKEGYAIDEVAYLPDFYLPEIKCFVEIKGTKPIREDMYKAYKLSVATRIPVHVFSGSVPEPGIEFWKDSDFETFSFGVPGVLFKGQRYSNQIWTINQCPKCDMIGFAPRGRIDQLPCGDGPVTERLSSKVVRAYKAARAARFEYV